MARRKEVRVVTEEERRRRLRKAYALLIGLAGSRTALTAETLPGDGVGAAEDADSKGQSSPHFTTDCIRAQDGGGGEGKTYPREGLV